MCGARASSFSASMSMWAARTLSGRHRPWRYPSKRSARCSPRRKWRSVVSWQGAQRGGGLYWEISEVAGLRFHTLGIPKTLGRKRRKQYGNCCSRRVSRGHRHTRCSMRVFVACRRQSAKWSFWNVFCCCVAAQLLCHPRTQVSWLWPGEG